MEQSEFRNIMQRIDLFQKIYANDPWSEFYAGMRTGLRRLYYGTEFVPSGGHRHWMSLSANWDHKGNWKDRFVRKQIRFDGKRMLGMGYRIGLHYGDIPQWEDDNPAIGDARKLRKILGWSVWEMAAFCGVSHRTVEGWEQGRTVSPGPAAELKKLLTI
jgi:hypothetical protein